MEWYERFYKKEEWCKKTVEIESELYEKLKKIANEELDASVNKIIDACIDNFELPEKIVLYKKEKSEINIVRSIILRESVYQKLEDMRNKYEISIYRLLNIIIKEQIEKYENNKWANNKGEH